MSKRKASGGGNSSKKANISPAVASATASAAEIEVPVLTLEQQLDLEISKLKDGTHPDLINKTGDLVKAKEKGINAADRHRKLLIKNINELYDFEVQDAEVSALILKKKNLDKYQHETTKLLTPGPYQPAYFSKGSISESIYRYSRETDCRCSY
jgi:hypothetical protein